MDIQEKCSQITVLKRPVEWSFPVEAIGPVRMFYDPFHESLIFLTMRNVHVSRKGSHKLFDLGFSVGGNHLEVKNASFSYDRLYLGVQISDVEVKVLDNRGSLMGLQSCRSAKAGNHIWNFYWIESKTADLVFVTSGGVELYKLSGESRSLRCIKTFRYETTHHWCLPSHQFFLLLNSALIFQGLRITKTQPEKLNKFEILGVEKSSANSRDTFYSQISLHEFYGSICCVFVDEVKAKLYLFRLQKELFDHKPKFKMMLTNQWNLFSKGPYRVSSVDNVLVANSMKSKVTLPMLFDLNEHSAGTGRIANPLPIVARYENDLGQVLPRVLELDPDKLEFKPPKFIVEAWKEDVYGGRMYTLALDLDQIIVSWGSAKPIELIRFLLERDAKVAKPVIIKLLLSMVKDYCNHSSEASAALERISNYFAYLNQVLFAFVLELGENARADNMVQNESFQRAYTPTVISNSKVKLRPSSRLIINLPTKLSDNDCLVTKDNLVVVSPSDIIHGVLLPCRDTGKRIVGVVVEYIRTLHRAKLKIPFEVTEVLMDMLVDRNEFYALHQLAQYHALPDDLRLANRLLELSNVYPPGKQLGIDMLLRLNNWPPICDLLIKEKKVEVALRLFVEKWDSGHISDSVGYPTAEKFLQAAKDLHDPVLFHNIFSYFENMKLFNDVLRKFESDFQDPLSLKGTKGAGYEMQNESMKQKSTNLFCNPTQ